MKTTKLLASILMMGFATHLFAQVSPGSALLDAGNFVARVHADGECFRSNSGTAPAFEWPKGSGNHAAFCYNLWIGGMDTGGALHMSAQTYRQAGRDFYAGPVSDTAEYNTTAYLLKWQKVWSVYAEQIDSFRTHFAAGTVDFSKYPTIETWPAHGDTSKGQLADIAPFVDVDLDGLYDPANDGDYPAISGDQAVYFIYNDQRKPHGETGGRAFPLEIHGMAYGYACADSGMSDVMFLNYEIFNRGDTSYNNMILGAWFDGDLGQWDDDYVGTDASRGLFFSYNGDSVDGDYGSHPPAVGAMFLGKSLRSMMYYQNDFSQIGNPIVDTDFYSYLKATWLDGTHLVDNGANGHAGSGGPGPDVNFFCPGDAGWCGDTASGWTEFSAGNVPFDRRQVAAIEPFSLDAGDSKVFNITVMVARGNYNAQLGSVCELQKLADRVNKAWTFGITPCADDIPLATPQHPVAGKLTLYPNPAQGLVTLQAALPLTDASPLVLDMNGRALAIPCSRINTLTWELDVAGLPAGIYCVQVEQGGHRSTTRLLVQ
jgi:hypothetical protein